MGVIDVLKEVVEGYREGGAEEALSEGAEEAVEEQTGTDL